ncbi:MAG: FtsX-like permease family protein [Pleurocapsa minor GSE-CHR-MK-17-07R]|jgi:ABC-type antimicrobial peptide transport system permease subunit|nr:FtsX-like permease family protein [Pleurocapsa minor GSE-CHR-MK 17-07R]
MFGRIAYYLRYAWRNLRRSGRWTGFAIFCIAAGVAAVVALRSLGLAIGDSLVDNVRAQNKGDITLSRGSNAGGFSFGVGQDENDVFAATNLARFEEWARENNATYSAYFQAGGVQITRVDQTSAGRPQFVSVFLIDPLTFPPDRPIEASLPAGTPLSSLLSEPHTIVISQNLADQQGIAMGDSVRVSGTETPYTVTGIVPTELEAGVSNLFAAFFGFAYVNRAEAAEMQLPTQPDTISVVLAPGTPVDRVVDISRELIGLTEARRARTTPELLEQNAQIGDIIGRFIVIMGLGALLIGGVGIINTMLVMVGRRSNEIAAIKTFGVKGRQVAAMFLSEAFLLGVMGSIVGCIAGLLLSRAVNSYGEAFLQQRLPTTIYPEAILFGLTMGIVVTLVFGILPVLTAIKIRPAQILRPNETVVPAAGCLTSGLVLLLVILVIGGIAGQILGNIPVGMIGMAVTLVLLGIITGLLWCVVWLVSKLPTFGNPDLRLALRNFTSRRIRTANTLLALSTGMFALSSISFVGAGTRELLNIQLTQTFGGNVLIFPLASLVSPALAETTLNAQLNNTEGILYRTRIRTANAEMLLVDGLVPPESDFQALMEEEAPRGAQRFFSNVQLQLRESTDPNAQPPAVSAGRTFMPEDEGQRVMLISGDFVTQSAGIVLGSVVRMQIEDEPYDFTVIGVLQNAGGLFSGAAQYVVPPGALPESAFDGFSLSALQVAPENLNQVLLDLSANPLLLSIDISFIDGLLSRIITQFSAIPTVVGLLSLLAAAVAMANTVSLATLERRRQIGILKSIGLKSGRVLWVMLLENTIIGLLGGLLGLGLSALMVGIFTALGQGAAIPLPSDSVPVAIALLLTAIGIAVAATLLSARPATRERVTNVLRYE